jgi:probable phosphoglycerate mutase
MKRLIFLLRHGTTGTDDGRKYIGHRDAPLNGDGERQALRLRRALDSWPINAAYCSDLIRCRQTAEIALGERHIEIIPHPALREMSMGKWEGCFREEIATAFPEEYAARKRDIENYRVEGGESFADCRTRVVPAFQKIIAASQGNILIAGHGGINRLLLCHILGMPTSNLFRLGQDHGCMNIISLDESENRVVLLNHTPSARADAATVEGVKNAQCVF